MVEQSRRIVERIMCDNWDGCIRGRCWFACTRKRTASKRAYTNIIGILEKEEGGSSFFTHKAFTPNDEVNIVLRPVVDSEEMKNAKICRGYSSFSI